MTVRLTDVRIDGTRIPIDQPDVIALGTEGGQEIVMAGGIVPPNFVAVEAVTETTGTGKGTRVNELADVAMIRPIQDERADEIQAGIGSPVGRRV